MFTMTEITRPKSGSIKRAVAIYGIGRSSLYGLARKHPQLFRKFGAKTLVDYEVLEDIIDGLPTGVDKDGWRGRQS
jgi:hypothetical protein